LPVDARQYDVAAAMLRELGIESVELMTNNPRKIEDLSELGIPVERRIPAHVAANPFSAPYLEVKRRRMQHELPSSPFHGEPSREPEHREGNGNGSAPSAAH
jgi:GTP cyclohydrolase II